MDVVANAVTACAMDPEAAFEWINRTEDDDVDFDELAISTPEFTSLDAKFRAALTKFAPGDLERALGVVLGGVPVDSGIRRKVPQ